MSMLALTSAHDSPLAHHERLHHAKQRNYARYLLSLREGREQVYNSPVELFYESSNTCNLRCAFCGVHLFGNMAKGAAGIMSRELMQAPEEWLAAGASMWLHGLGEPLMNPRVVEFGGAAGREGMQVGFFTNGRMLDEARAEAIVAGGISAITISISTAHAELY